MTALLPTSRKICWLSLNSLLSIGRSEESEEPQKSQTIPQNQGEPVQHKPGLRRRFDWSWSASWLARTAPDWNGGFLIGNYLLQTAMGNKTKCGHVDESSLLPEDSPKQRPDEKNKENFTWCKCVDVNCSDGGSLEGLEKEKKRVLDYADAPFYLKFNPYITGGYRSNLTPKECIKSLFWWTNETLNIWTHFLGWIFFFGLSIYDSMGMLDIPTSHPWDQKVITMLLICFQACMLLSALYHVFCCCSEKFYRRWLSADLFGVSLSLLAIYISGIYYAFSCVPFWLNFYLVTVGVIFVTAVTANVVMQVIPMLNTEDKFQWRLVVFGSWAAYGVVPTFHWAVLHGGMQSEAVSLLLPRIFWMYVISAAAFFFYLSRFPEKIKPGLVNFIGSSHQIWHILIVAALYHWHNTGIVYLHFRATHPCSEEYAALFPSEVNAHVQA